jgi:2-hydroxychromene-2-carboxylate isomerase
VAAAQSAAVKLLSQPTWLAELVQLSDALWHGDSGPHPEQGPAESSLAAREALARGAALRQRWGHYLGATFYFEGEWYWGVDRLHYLEQRLNEAGLARSAKPEAPLVPVKSLHFWPAQAKAIATPPPVIHFYCSLRSPYTYLAAAQVRRLAEHYGAELRLRFVLPMVMRGLPVPLAKRLYILHDNKREAERLGIPFGCVVDPVGEPTERGLALLYRAMALGRGPALAESFLQGVFADGIDAGSDAGLLLIANRAGLSADDVAAALADSGWRAEAEANRADLFARGLWGVPSFRLDEGPAIWGQDRLWMLERDLIQVVTAPLDRAACA